MTDIEKIQKSLWAIGIDFGTTKTIVASFPRTTNQERVKPSFSEYSPNVADNNRSDAVPTAIAIHKDSLNEPGGIKFLIGRQALDLQKRDYQKYQLITDLKKRLMTNNKEERAIEINGKFAEVEGIAASFLWKLLASTENLNLKSETYGISISVPAKAHLIQRMSTRFSLAVTGFEQQIDLVEEPVAAFLYHRHLKPTYFDASGKSRFALVVDFGGGTCDLAVVEYSDGKLPKVRGRSMGIFGGQIIDSLLVEKLWLNRKSKEDGVLRLTTKDFASMLDFERWKILEKARSVKEYLSGSNNAISVDISGFSPNQTGRISTPRTTTTQLTHILETENFPADYDSISNSVTASLRGHLENLLARVLENAEIKRGAISTLILAGGSVSLPGIRDWVIRFLSSDAGIGAANTQLKDNNVFDNDNLQCVAGGSSVHQLYRYHEEKNGEEQLLQRCLKISG